MNEIVKRTRPLWVDFHCHLDLYPDHVSLITQCDRERVATLTVTTTPKAWQRNNELAAHSRYVRVALGLHPQLVAERADELLLFERLLPQARYVGEVGLDAGPRFWRSLPDQERVFERILCVCAEHGGKILSVHSVRTVTKILDLIEKILPAGRGKVVLHWFTGTAAEARRAIGLGCYFSINSEMLSSPRHQTLIASLPADRILTETDGPFVLCKGQPVRPHEVKNTIARLSVIFNCTREMMSTMVLSNLTALVS